MDEVITYFSYIYGMSWETRIRSMENYCMPSSTGHFNWRGIFLNSFAHPIFRVTDSRRDNIVIWHSKKSLLKVWCDLRD